MIFALVEVTFSMTVSVLSATLEKKNILLFLAVEENVSSA